MPRRILATDLAALSRCDREVYLNHHGDPTLRATRSAYQQWLSSQGQSYEQQVMADFDIKQPPYTIDNLEVGAEITLEFMKKGVPLIAQGVLMHADLVGIPDLLERVEGHSTLGDHFYRPVDVKSASTINDAHRLQVMAYCKLLEHIQGVRPDGALLMSYPPDDRENSPLYRRMPVDFDDVKFAEAYQSAQSLVGGEEPLPFFSAICSDCAWRNICVPMVHESNDVSLIPGIKRTVWRELRGRGISTLTDLAKLAPSDIISIKGIGEKTAPDLIRKAQALAQNALVRVGRVTLPDGPIILFDIESVPTLNTYYLLGTMYLETESWKFEPFIAERIEDEGENWKRFVAHINMVPGTIVHYGNYERTAVQKLSERHGTDDQVAGLLARMVDLERAVKDSAILPLFSYSLKAIAPWIGFQWSSQVSEGSDSVLEYVHWLEDGNREHLARILHYNEEDCRATLAVFDWLRDLPLT